VDGTSHQLLAFGAAFVAGAINSVAGGGTLVSFPALIWLGLPSITANATSTVAIWPGSLGGAWGFRHELKDAEPRLYGLVVPSLIGGIAGALLLRLTPTATFDRLVPLLILFATCLFMAQDPVQRRLRTGARAQSGSRWLIGALFFQLLVALYGGYFGAGIGILMLAALGIMGLSDIHQMNALKNLLALCINGIAAVYFVWMRMVMARCDRHGGRRDRGRPGGGAGVARRLGRVSVRRIVIAVGLVMAVKLMFRR
jgi:uncharacterized protein